MASNVNSLPAATKVVIVGGGVIGTSVAYHLAGAMSSCWNRINFPPEPPGTRPDSSVSFAPATA